MLDPAALEQFIDEEGIYDKGNSQSFIFSCPRCLKHAKLYIRRSDGMFRCWSCGAEKDGFRGYAEKALSEIAGIPLSVVRQRLYGADHPGGEELDSRVALDFTAADFVSADDELDHSIVPTLTYPWDVYPIDHPNSSRGAQYLEKERGVPLEVGVRYGLQYSTVERRVIFPVHLDGRLVGWQGRIIVDHKTWDDEKGEYVEGLKVASTKGIPRDHTLMFEDRLDGVDHAVVTEGPLDAMKCDLIGGNTATMGKAVSRGQIRILQRRGIKRLYLGLDPDAANETMQLVKQFSQIDCFLLRAPKPHKDLGAMSMDAVRELFLSAQPVLPSHFVLHLKF